MQIAGTRMLARMAQVGVIACLMVPGSLPAMDLSAPSAVPPVAEHAASDLSGVQGSPDLSDASDGLGGLDAFRWEALLGDTLAEQEIDWGVLRFQFESAAAEGSSVAMGYLGWMHEEGVGVPIDVAQAVYWYEKAARAGELHFAQKLGWMYLAGQGLAADRSMAEKWFRYAMDRDHAPAYVGWASVLIADALGGRQDVPIATARALLLEGLAKGEATASYFLARLYLEGIGGHPLDPAEGAYFAAIGAEAGNTQLQGWLAYLYVEGEGVPQDWVEAAKWANLAAAGGDRFGDGLRRWLESEMLTPEDRMEARQRAIDWALRGR
jgi:TPR repeat protein